MEESVRYVWFVDLSLALGLACTEALLGIGHVWLIWWKRKSTSNDVNDVFYWSCFIRFILYIEVWCGLRCKKCKVIGSLYCVNECEHFSASEMGFEWKFKCISITQTNYKVL